MLHSCADIFCKEIVCIELKKVRTAYFSMWLQNFISKYRINAGEVSFIGICVILYRSLMLGGIRSERKIGKIRKINSENRG